MNNSNVSIFEIKEEIDKQLHHSYLKKFLPKPIIDDDKLFILSTIIDQSNLDPLEKRSYIVTTMLVQIALDTHDLVTQSNNESDSDLDKKRRQLTVLAGDYYSGLYYYLLSKLNDIPMIQTLASAIKEINEKKMLVYYREFDTVDSFMESLRDLESVLLLRVATHVKVGNVSDFIQNWLIVRKLMKERDTYVSGRNSHVLTLMTDGPAFHMNETVAIEAVDSCIEQYQLIVNDMLDSLPQPFETVKELLYNKREKSIQVMEEG
ncbi:heptaprenyl diphosphate synthase component 1 [Aquibacillus salsiterrae]|uniref:Heptaprenyl diphosphate synthase component 1 n=1 Tax=Aquibacillus salsiterrae TaxID=2950439 RepID=A0A9X3WCG6_9BACI|nr:heptaprenyl diphosphate synthase component 1 [Aquibacillus salsiterrae]MDC3415380.1 heptaprenyl diphosphate synthase component 1 [Aquibacillus salsiterrae]